jgi:hypothetical protein
MIVPSKNQKTYGVLHTENYFSFLGFCKKVNSDKIQKVDILIDNTLIDTIIADKHIEKIEDIYELEGFGFTYLLPNEYVGQKNLISFKNHETQENLQNSPYELINESHPKFNEIAFLNSLENPVNEENFKDIYCANSIGFLATEENLADKEFIEYLKELIIKFPHTEFKAFYFKNNEKELINHQLKEICNVILLSNISYINTTIFLVGRFNPINTVQVNKIIMKLHDTFVSYFFDDISMMKPSSEQLRRDNQLYKNALLNANIPESFWINHFELSLLNYINSIQSTEKLDENVSLFKMRHFDYIKIALENKNFIDMFYKIKKYLIENS